MVVVSVAGLSSVAPFAISSTLSFPYISMCPGTHNTSMLALLFSSRKVVAVSAIDICWLGPGSSFVIASFEDVSSASNTIFDYFLSHFSRFLLELDRCFQAPQQHQHFGVVYFGEFSHTFASPSPFYSFPVSYPTRSRVVFLLLLFH